VILRLANAVSPQAHVARGATYIFVQGFLNAALGVLYVWFLLHTKEIAGQILFTESDFGLFTILSLILTLTSTLGILALKSASVRYIAHYLAGGKEAEARSVVARVLQVSAITSSAIAVSLFLMAGSLANIFNSSVYIFYFLPISSVIQIFYFQAQGFLQGLQRMREIAALGLLYTLVQYFVGVTLIYLGFGVLGIVIGWLFALSLSCLIALSLAFRTIGISRHTHDLKPLLAFSAPIYVTNLLTSIVGWVDQIFIFPFMGIEALGVYNLAVRASVVPNLISNAIVVSLFPKLSELHSALGTQSLRDAFKTSTRYAALLGFPMALMVATLAYPITVLFATVRFVDAVIPLAVMCVASVPTILGSAIFPTLFALTRTRIASLITMTSIVLEAFISYIALAHFGAGLVGVAFSRLFASLAVLVLGAYVLWASLKVEFDKEAVWKSAAAAILMVISLFALEFSRGFLAPSSYQFLVLRLRQLPIYVAVGVTVYLLSLVAFKAVKQRDVELLNDYLPQRLQWIARLVNRVAQSAE